jgi:hypothetical protein
MKTARPFGLACAPNKEPLPRNTWTGDGPPDLNPHPCAKRSERARPECVRESETGIELLVHGLQPVDQSGAKKGGFACVYVASAESGRPCRVGYALDLVDAVKRLARSSPVPIDVDNAVWVPGRGITTTTAQSVLASIASRSGAGGWHDLPAASVVRAVELETFRLYPNAVIVPHDQLISKRARKAAPAVRGPDGRILARVEDISTARGGNGHFRAWNVPEAGRGMAGRFGPNRPAVCGGGSAERYVSNSFPPAMMRKKVRQDKV